MVLRDTALRLLTTFCPVFSQVKLLLRDRSRKLW